jgi:tight adherence protein B
VFLPSRFTQGGEGRAAQRGPFVVLSLLAFVTVSLFIVVGHQLVMSWLNADTARVTQRIAEEFGKDLDPGITSTLYKNLEHLHLEGSAALEQAPLGPPPSKGVLESAAVWLEQARLPMAARHFFLLVTGISLTLGLAATWWTGLLVGLFAATVGAIVPIVWASNRRAAIRDRYFKQLPNAFELMARVIRSGQSVPQSLQAVADAFEDPLASEFGQCLQQQNLGMRPEITFQKMAERAGILEMRIFAMAMLIQRETGGNLSEILDRLAGLVRARVKLKQQVRTLTAEGRLQGWTLVVLPFLIFTAVMIINRPYAEVLLRHVPLLIGTLVSMGIGLLWIRKIVNIEE